MFDELVPDSLLDPGGWRSHTLKKPASKRPGEHLQILHVRQTCRLVVRSSMRHLLNGCTKTVYHPDRFTLFPWQQTSRKISRRTTIACSAKAATGVSSERGGKAMLCTRVDRWLMTKTGTPVNTHGDVDYRFGARANGHVMSPKPHVHTLDNFNPPHPQISQFWTSSKGWDGWTKQINPPQHQMSCALAWTLTLRI